MKERFVAKLSLLKQIEPRTAWVFSLKEQILTQEQAKKSQFFSVFDLTSIFRYINISMRKPVLAMAALVFLLGGAFFVQTLMLPSEEPVAQSKLELAKIQLERVKNAANAQDSATLSIAIKEFAEIAKSASKESMQLVEKEPSRALQAGLELVQLQKDKAAIEQILGTALDAETGEELKNATKYVVENELEDLLTRTFAKDQKKLFEEAIIAYQAEDYETALERIWQLTNNQL